MSEFDEETLRNAERAGVHTWQTRKCAAVLRPDENLSQGAARMLRVSFAMFRLFRIVFPCVILLHIIVYYNAAHVSTIWSLYIDHTRDTAAAAAAPASDSYDTRICYIYAYTRVRKSRLVTMAGYIKDRKKKLPKYLECRSPFASGDRFPVWYRGSGGGLQRANEERPSKT